MLDEALRGFLVGVLVALLVVYVFRPKKPYPEWMLMPYEQPWMLLILVALVAVVYPWDKRIGLLMVLLLLGVGLDIKVFGQTYVAAKSDGFDYPLMGGDGGADLADSVGGGADFADAADAAGVPLARIGLPVPNYPLVSEDLSLVPGSPAAF